MTVQPPGGPFDHEPADQRRRLRGLGMLAGLGVAVVAVVALVAVLSRQTEPVDDYDSTVEAAVVDACVDAIGDEGDRDLCRCAYERFTADLPFEEFERLDEELAGGGDTPDALLDAVETCQIELDAVSG
ncbi:MAG: hypothetical protein S0880_19980 [Actinomycetota bacterium]|nr:hypothetical protein [Actinomycetota bacterium]